MTADERLLTDHEFEARLHRCILDAGPIVATDAIRRDRAARIEQEKRLRGLLERVSISCSHAGDDGFPDLLSDIRAELAREGQG